MSQFKKATRQQRKLRMAIVGPSGSGKTFTALTIAKSLGDKIGLIDTERSSAGLYAVEVADFYDVCLESFEPRKYIEAIADAKQEGFPVLIIDSLSHAWAGKGGLLDQSNARGGKFDAWRHLTPQHNDLVDAILAYPGHVIVTMRTKTDYVVEKDDKGKNTVKKVGLAPVQKDGMEYEMDVVGYMDTDNTLTIDKSRCSALSGAVIRKPGAPLAQTLVQWLNSGAAPTAAPATPPPALVANNPFAQRIAAASTRDELKAMVDEIKSAKTAGEIGKETDELFMRRWKELAT